MNLCYSILSGRLRSAALKEYGEVVVHRGTFMGGKGRCVHITCSFSGGVYPPAVQCHASHWVGMAEVISGRQSRGANTDGCLYKQHRGAVNEHCQSPCSSTRWLLPPPGGLVRVLEIWVRVEERFVVGSRAQWWWFHAEPCCEKFVE